MTATLAFLAGLTIGVVGGALAIGLVAAAKITALEAHVGQLKQLIALFTPSVPPG